ncbi:AzlD domain-containing protein [Loigolactobacillus iwatensis]|uniref:AzlD domain-containing protein n=1 Tax=Loigolactobacillus iwatensis TaxID=1267156 RepID=UPI000F7E0980|nr:AzlD domain-containing protein [Loigolactobacillus iwatensis]
MTRYIFWTIIGCGIVTVLSRTFPFLLVKNFALPKWLIHFLSFVPIAIMTALFVENLLIPHQGRLPGIDLENLLASLPAILTAIITKSLLAIVVVGIIAMALIRFFALV